MNLKNEKSVFLYQNYREFLKEAYLDEKKKRASYSYRQFASDLGFKPSNFIHLIVSGKRNLSLEAVQVILDHFKWPAREKKYFHFLVLYNQAQNEGEKIEFKDKLEHIRGQKKSLVKPDQETYFSTWYLPVLREIVSLKSFVSNLTWIARKIIGKVGEEKIKDGLKLLERLGMITKKSGKWVQNEDHLSTETEVTSDMIYNYHQEMIRLSLNALHTHQDKRDISAMTMSLSEAQFQNIKQKLIDFRDEIQEYLHQSNDPGTNVAQLNIQLFKVTHD